MSYQAEHPKELLYARVFDPFTEAYARQIGLLDLAAILEPPTQTDNPAAELIVRYAQASEAAAVAAVDELDVTVLQSFIELHKYGYLTSDEAALLGKTPTIQSAKEALVAKLPRNVVLAIAETALWIHSMANYIETTRPDLYTQQALGGILLRSTVIPAAFASMHDDRSSALTKAMTEPAGVHDLNTTAEDVLRDRLIIPARYFRIVGSEGEERLAHNSSVRPPRIVLPSDAYTARCPAMRVEDPSAQPDEQGKRPPIMDPFLAQFIAVYIYAISRAEWLPAEAPSLDSS